MLCSRLLLQVAGCTLELCNYAHGVLAVTNMQPPASLPVLLSTLIPSGRPALRALRLYRCVLDAAVLQRCTMLAALIHLQINRCHTAAGGWEATIAALFSQAPLLRSLHIDSCFQGTLPLCLIAHEGLMQLSLVDNRLQELPAGPYLASLQHLSLRASLHQLPSVLTAATALTCLEVQCEHLSRAPPALATEAMVAVLSCLPQLRSLQLAHCGLQQLPVQGWAGLSALRSLDLSSNSFTSLPAELHQATALRQLNLSRNRSMRPTAQQLGALLSCLPGLEELRLAGLQLTELPDHLPPGKLFICIALHCAMHTFNLSSGTARQQHTHRRPSFPSCYAGLLSLDISVNRMHSLPAGLSCESLTSLNLGCRPDLALSRMDVVRLLDRLPQLRELHDWQILPNPHARDCAYEILTLRANRDN